MRGFKVAMWLKEYKDYTFIKPTVRQIMFECKTFSRFCCLTSFLEAIEKKGGNAFMELSVPEAVIKFRQGIGRLIRKSDDKGVVVVLDRRIYEKRYGSIFTSSMPRCKTMYDSLINITKKVSDFLE